MTTYINIFGGPGAGKSTNAARLFSILKLEGYNTELVTEVAKDFVWEEREKTMEIQPYITMKQYRNLFRLRGKVDFVVSDSPLLMGVLYARKYSPELPESYERLIQDLHNDFISPSLNIMLTRGHKYDTNGRYQTEEQAEELDEDLIKVLEDSFVDFHLMNGDDLSTFILEWIRKNETSGL